MKPTSPFIASIQLFLNKLSCHGYLPKTPRLEMCWEMGVMAGALVEDTKQLEQRRHFHTCELFPLETKVTSCQNGNEPRGRRGWGDGVSEVGPLPSPLPITHHQDFKDR